MKIENALSNFNRWNAKFASLHTYEGNTTVKILDAPCYVSGRGWDNTIALKDVEYNVLDGILYIKGTRIYHYKLGTILEPVTLWSKRQVWKINHKYNDKLVEPFIETDVVIPKWLIFKKTIKGIDFEKTNLKELKEWYLSKEEFQYEVALSNFTLKEA